MSQITKRLFKSTAAYGYILGIFRIAFGVLGFIQLYKYKGIIYDHFKHSNFRVPYDFFEWVQPLPPDLVNVCYVICLIACVLFALGIFFRTSAIIMTIGMSYFVAVDVALYNNHYYFFAMFAFLFIFTNADRAFSLKNILQKKETIRAVPYWQLFLFQFHLWVLYFFGAIAKINGDWLFRAQPVKLWLPKMYGNWYTTLSDTSVEILAYFVAWSGFIIDLFVPFMLFHKRLKWVAIVVLLIFHTINSHTFSIGLFPFMGMLSLVLFLEV